jgi:hypothetical protein
MVMQLQSIDQSVQAQFIDCNPLAVRLKELESVVLADIQSQKDSEEQCLNKRKLFLSAQFEEAFIRYFGINLWADCCKAGADYFLIQDTIVWAVPLPSGIVFDLFYTKHYDGLASSDTPWTYCTGQEFNTLRSNKSSYCGLHSIRPATTEQLVKEMVKVNMGLVESDLES